MLALEELLAFCWFMVTRDYGKYIPVVMEAVGFKTLVGGNFANRSENHQHEGVKPTVCAAFNEDYFPHSGAMLETWTLDFFWSSSD